MYTCLPIERAAGATFGTFSSTLSWPRSRFASSGATYFMMVGARGNPDGSCSWDWGWSLSAHTYLTN